MANLIKCGKCGASLALVGIAHRCVTPAEPHQKKAIKPEPVEASTYAYRDPEKRRAYMRDYMRRKRTS